MEKARVKYNLGRTVNYRGSEYIFTAFIMRQGKQGFAYQAELKDPNARSALVIADLKEIKEVTT